MSLTVAQFRSDFSEFADTSVYADAQITYWLNVTANLINAERWDTLATLGQELVTAHYLVLSARDRTAARTGGLGLPVGLQTAKSVADVSASYDYTALLIADAGAWNQTSYGQRFFSLVRMMGAGGMQIHGSYCTNDQD